MIEATKALPFYDVQADHNVLRCFSGAMATLVTIFPRPKLPTLLVLGCRKLGAPLTAIRAMNSGPSMLDCT